MTTTLENVTVTLADLRAKVDFLTDQLTERTAQRDEAELRTANVRRRLDACEAHRRRSDWFLAKAVEILPVLCEDAPDQPALEGAQQDGRVWLARMGVAS